MTRDECEERKRRIEEQQQTGIEPWRRIAA
jgi:hypothetical protein